ncbi:MAG: hypothetical protein PUB21_11580 [Bacteroidales bacterium]|nr:hypothetical protein [Bacteroidales bacterium]
MKSYVIHQVCYATGSCREVRRTKIFTSDIETVRRELREEHPCEKVLLVYDTMEE